MKNNRYLHFRKSNAAPFVTLSRWHWPSNNSRCRRSLPWALEVYESVCASLRVFYSLQIKSGHILASLGTNYHAILAQSLIYNYQLVI